MFSKMPHKLKDVDANRLKNSRDRADMCTCSPTNICTRILILCGGHDWSHSFDRKQSRLNHARVERVLWGKMKINRESEKSYMEDFI